MKQLSQHITESLVLESLKGFKKFSTSNKQQLDQLKKVLVDLKEKCENKLVNGLTDEKLLSQTNLDFVVSCINRIISNAKTISPDEISDNVVLFTFIDDKGMEQNVRVSSYQKVNKTEALIALAFAKLMENFGSVNSNWLSKTIKSIN